MQLVEISDTEIRLNSGLDEYSFGKTNYDSILSQEGLFWDGENFSSWSFNDVQAFNVPDKTERQVFYCGKNPLAKDARTLNVFLQADDESALIAAKSVCAMLTQAAKEGISVPMVGAGGILVSISGQNAAEKTAKILFLPDQLFSYASNALAPAQCLQEHSGWINQTITGLPAICFLRATIVYKLLTKNLPYPATDTVERNADILDRNFLPLELNIQDINPALALHVNKALKLNSNAVNVPGKKQKGKSSEDLTPTPEFPLDLLDEALKKSLENRTDDSSFSEKVAAYKKTQNTRIKTVRNLRRNSSIIITTLIVTTVLIIISISTVKTKGTEYSTMGLTSVQTIQGFFYGVNTKSTTLLTNFTSGKNPQSHVDVISQIYVLSKQRRAYNKDNGYASPANWLFYARNEERWQSTGLYGITNLQIDGKQMELDVELHAKNEKMPPVTQENTPEGTITLQDKDKVTHEADYYLLHTEGENFGFVVEEVHDVFTLTYRKGHWLITDIQTESTMIRVHPRTFKADYWNLLAQNGGDVIKTVDELRQKYDWLPSHYDMQAEYDAQIYAITHPMEALGF